MQPPAIPSDTAREKADIPVTTRPYLPAWLPAVFLGLVTMVLYWPATRCDFVLFDDPLYVLDNPHVTSGLTLANAAWAFRTGYASNWHPVTWLSHMLDCQMYGLIPYGHHLTSVLLHALNTALVFLLLRQMTGAMWRSLVVAALFGSHPAHVESVAWVAERKDVLSTCFGLLALMFYVRHAQTSKTQNPTSKKCYWLSLVFFALGLMSKPMLVTFPFVLLLLDYWPLNRFTICDLRFTRFQSVASLGTRHWSLLLEKIPFFTLAAMGCVATFVAQKEGGVVMTALPFSARVENALISYCRYLGELFWPTKLAIYYPLPGHWPLAEVLLAGGLLLGISALGWALGRRYAFLPMGWLWFVGTLVPVIGLVQVGTQAMADQYTYLPSLGILISTTWWVCEMTRGWRFRAAGLSVAGLAVVAVCMGLTRQQLRYWQDSEALFQRAIAVTENNYLEHNDLGLALYHKGRFDEAIRQEEEAISLRPDYTDAHNNLGMALAGAGRIDEAILQFRKALRLNQGDAQSHNNLANALYARGRLDEAIREYQEALRLKPDFATARQNLGLVLAQNQVNGAISQAEEAVRLKPDDAQAHYNLAVAFYANGQIDEAIRQFQEALRLKPDDALAHNNLGIAFAQKGQMDEAIGQFQEALRLKPDYASAHDNLAHAQEMKNAPASP